VRLALPEFAADDPSPPSRGHPVRPRPGRRAALAAAAVATLATLAACSSPSGPAAEDTPRPTTALESDGTVVLYSGRNEALVQPLIDEFQAATGIDVEVRYDGTTALAALLLEEGERTPADVFLSQDAGALGAVAKEGLFAALPEEVTEAVPAGFTSTDGSWVGLTGRSRVIAYDGGDLTAEQVPDSVLDLTAPQWSGRVGIAPTNASFQAFVTAFRLIEGDEAATAWLEGMVANDVQVFESNGAILEAVDAGTLGLGLINHYYWFEKAAEVGEDAMRAQIAFLPPGDPGALVNVTGAGILAPAADDAEALALVEFLLSEQAQTYFAEETFEYPLAAGVAAADALPPIEDLRNEEIDLSDLDGLQETVELISAAGLT
jgi:iron(III) transport system substrate-binding protein